ncbi:hypothetical protein CC2G_014374 [Coprinopsis cinerea AmutBmut pab1-1]|nr:hypothetical protein CC2G_014374 [Coprinopsis cinerea AmutBmut pab1-1]
MASADRSLAPPPELLTGRPEQPLSPGVQTSTASSPTTRLHEITSHDERPTGKLERPLPLGNQTSISSPPTMTRYESSKPEPAWVAHFKRHEHLHARIMEKETATQRQSREDRAANPPVSNVRVYEWYPSERDPNVYERVAAGVKNSRDTLALYSARQKVFDAFCREWDCCEYFGKGDEEIDLDEWGPEDLDLPLPESLRQRITKAYSAYVDDEDEEEVGAVTEEFPLSPSLAVGQGGGNPSRSVFEPLNLAEQSMAINTTLVEDEEGMFTVSTSWLAACLEDEVNKTLGLHYGFVPPLPSVSIAADDGPRVRRDFYRLLGLCDDEEQPEEYFASTHYRSALQFIHSHSNRQTPHPGSWDLKDDVIHPLKHRSRLRCLRIVSIPQWTNVDIVDEGLSDCVPVTIISSPQRQARFGGWPCSVEWMRCSCVVWLRNSMKTTSFLPSRKKGYPSDFSSLVTTSPPLFTARLPTTPCQSDHRVISSQKPTTKATSILGLWSWLSPI